jgi:hypothetical protein
MTDAAETPPPVGVPVTSVEVGTGAAAGRAPEQRVVSSELLTRRHDDPDDGPEPLFLEMLPAEALNGASLPLAYRLAASTGYGGVTVRLAESDAARTRSYPCRPFYKPISRCVGGTP